MLNQEIRTKTKTRSQSIVDASDVAKLLLALVYVLDGLGQPELEAHNRLQICARDRVRDPFRPIIGAINLYLHAYHMYRAEALRVPEIDRDPDEVCCQDPSAKDQQPGHVRRQHPQKQQGGGGCNGAVAAPG